MSTPSGSTIPAVAHNFFDFDGHRLHYVSAGESGSPVLLIHGFPETWWTFHELIPLLSTRHRVFAVDLRGFGDSSVADDDYGSAAAADDLRQLIAYLDVGPVHLAAQDISGATAFRLAAGSPELVRSLTGIEMGLAGFGLEALADVTHGGSWHIGVLAADGIPELLLTGKEEDFLCAWAFPAMSASPDAVTDDDIAEFARTYARPGGWRGASALYRSMLHEGSELRAIAAESPLAIPTMAVGSFGGDFTQRTLTQIAQQPPHDVRLENVGHYVALEAADSLAAEMLPFLGRIDSD